MPGRVVSLNTSSHSSCSRSGQDASGGVMWYQEGPSGSPGAAHDIIAIAQRRDSGAEPDQAHAVVVGDQVPLAGELDRPFRSSARAASITPSASG